MQPEMLSSTESRKPVVWLVNEGGHDYSSLDHYGRVIVMSRGGVNPFGPDRMMVLLGARLSQAKSNDYLALSGLPLLNALAICMWLKKFGSVNLLQFSSKEGKYKKLHLSDAAVAHNALGEPGPAD